ncbi:50S ribosomal protein L33 [Coxiella endosymbiont of Amblyomma sculptum]|uniref:50S ribosomal protein L33 n=1 Tax=Coxiella endosymbiont of Amblyomma sculptum TaxID=2487929 RepID=UPI00132F0880|nr:50S ribosomal protein L33 [Coxiella endosymbiont of Amblyomma sculptum]QHG92469.1 50S ribosomal protein L33 [Coxiella endosymbiont of Amblyomma sculptum]
MTTNSREKIVLRSTGNTKYGKKTGTYYTTTKNKRNTEKKLSVRKYDPRAWNSKTGKCGRHVVFKEEKIPK